MLSGFQILLYRTDEAIGQTKDLESISVVAYTFLCGLAGFSLIGYRLAESPTLPVLDRDFFFGGLREFLTLPVGQSFDIRGTLSLISTAFMTSPHLPVPPAMERVRSGGSSYSVSPLAQAAIERDLEEDSEDDVKDDTENADSRNTSSDSDDSTLRPVRSGRSMVGSYRRPSYTAGGSRATVGAGLRGSGRQPTKSERHEARREERSLLRDNDVIPPKHPQTEQRAKGFVGRVLQLVPSVGVPGGNRKVLPSDEEAAGDFQDPQSGLAETAPLLGNPELPYGGQADNVDQKFEDAVIEGKIKTTWQREAKVIGRYSAPLVLTFVLQYSLTVVSVFTVGHLGKAELGAVSLASMTANITGYAVYQGLATSLDTLCAQAYGSGHKKLVGLQTQRMVYFLCIITIPMGAIWLSADQILQKIVPEKEVARKNCNSLVTDVTRAD